MLEAVRNFFARTANRVPWDIGDVLVNLGHVTVDKVKEAASVQQSEKRKKIGQVLVDLGHVSKVDLEEALKVQKQLRNGHGAKAMATIVDRKLDRALAANPKPAAT